MAADGITESRNYGGYAGQQTTDNGQQTGAVAGNMDLLIYGIADRAKPTHSLSILSIHSILSIPFRLSLCPLPFVLSLRSDSEAQVCEATAKPQILATHICNKNGVK